VSGVFLATYVVAQRPSLGQVQIRQHEKGSVLFRLAPGRDFRPDSDLAYVRAETRRYLGADTRVTANVVASLPAEPSGKFLFSRSTVAPDFIAPLLSLPEA
jgi:hypothetical protein